MLEVTDHIMLERETRPAQRRDANSARVELRVFDGPNLFASFPAIVLEFPIPSEPLSPIDKLPQAIEMLLPDILIPRANLLDWQMPFESLVAAFATLLQDWHGPSDLQAVAERTVAGSGRVSLEYQNVLVTRDIGSVAVHLAAITHQLPTAAGQALLGRKIHGIGKFLELNQPTGSTRALVRAARRAGIPFYRLSSDSHVVQYGQGKRSWHFHGSSNQSDSPTGHLLQRKKNVSNTFIHKLGFPGVTHAIAESPSAAVQIASRLGYPVVVKPINGHQGNGVAVGLLTEREVVTAFAEANVFSPGRVVVERYVEGDDHRLLVWGGRLIYAVRRSPPCVIGDGNHTIAELIQLENTRRSSEAKEFIKNVSVDDQLILMLDKQALSLRDRPRPGRVIKLRNNANVATGGTAIDVTDRIHPDNKQMAETIARCFRLDSAGIDFLTPDIGCSWRSITCAIIEVNSGPEVGSDGSAMVVLKQKFPDGARGRIPTVLVLSDRPTLSREVYVRLKGTGVSVGYVNGADVILNAQHRTNDGAILADRVMALLLDPLCEALVIGSNEEEILERGLPIDRFSLVVIGRDQKPSTDFLTLLTASVEKIVDELALDTVISSDGSANISI